MRGALGKALTAAEAEPNPPSLDQPLNSGPSKGYRATEPKIVPSAAYEVPILESLYELGGTSKASEVLVKVELKMKHLLSEVDYQPVNNGNEIRWRKRANFARLALVKRGLLGREAGWGIWELTEQGTAEVENKGSMDTKA